MPLEYELGVKVSSGQRFPCAGHWQINGRPNTRRLFDYGELSPFEMTTIVDWVLVRKA
jgi:hypothetical protein